MTGQAKKKQLQFQLWQECNSHCEFCYLGRQTNHTPDDAKLSAVEKAIAKISDPETWKEYDVVSYLGGQFFQGQMKDPAVKAAFMRLMAKTAELYFSGAVREVWLYVTLTIGDQADLYEALSYFAADMSRFWILTSYDTRGRFHTPRMRDNWEFHMKNIHAKYPGIKFNTTTILTDDCITKYLDGEFSFRRMSEEFHTSFFIKACGTTGCSKAETLQRMPWFFPTRAKFIRFLRKFRLEESEQMWTKLFNIFYRADILYRNFNDKQHQMVPTRRHKDTVDQIESGNEGEMRKNKCGHMLTYAAYADCDGCVVCDKTLIQEILK